MIHIGTFAEWWFTGELRQCEGDAEPPGETMNASDRRQFATQFNMNPKKAVAELRKNFPDFDSAPAVAALLSSCPGMSKRNIGEFIGGVADFNQAVLLEFLVALDFTDLGLDDALRKVSSSVSSRADAAP